MPDFTPSRSDAIRDGLMQHAAARTPARRATAAPVPAQRGAREARRPPATRWVTAVAAFVLVGGAVATVTAVALNRDALVAGTPTPSPTITASPTPTPTPPPFPSPTPTPTAPAPDPADPTTWIVSQAGMGPLVIGMPFRDAIAAVPQAQDACGHAYSIRPDRLFFASWNGGPDDPLNVATWSRADGPRTAEGIGIGSTPDEVRAAYPDAVEVTRQGLYLQSGAMFFRIETGLVDSIGVTSDEVPWEYCG